MAADLHCKCVIDWLGIKSLHEPSDSGRYELDNVDFSGSGCFHKVLQQQRQVEPQLDTIHAADTYS